MHAGTNIGVILLIGLLVAIGGYQGQRIDDIQASEAFYRWIVTASTHLRMQSTLEYRDSTLSAEPMDDELFAELVALTESELPDLPVDIEKDTGRNDEPFPKILRAVRQNEDNLVWKIATSQEARSIRDSFFEYRDAGLLQSVGTQFNVAHLYGSNDQSFGVGVTSLFFGFRKLSANFLWLQVDKYWHLGQAHRMVPLMRTTVTLDPNFIDAFLLGAWHMAYNITAKLEMTPEPEKEWNPKYNRRLGRKEEWYYIAADFLKDGIRKNPRNYKLYFDLGYGIYDQKVQDYNNAVRYMDAALDHPHKRWVPRMLYRAQTKNGQFEDSTEGWHKYLDIFPNHTVALGAIRTNDALVAEATAEEAFACAEASQAAAEMAWNAARKARDNNNIAQAELYENAALEAEGAAQDMNDLAHLQTAAARTIWIPMYEERNDPQAEAHLARLDALKYIEEDREYEAIAALEKAKWAYGGMWEEASEMMMEIKAKYGLDYTESERMAIERKKESAPYLDEYDLPPVIHRVDCGYIDEGAI